MFDKSTFSDIFIKVVAFSNFYNLQKYQALNPRAHLINIVFNAQVLLAILKGVLTLACWIAKRYGKIIR